MKVLGFTRPASKLQTSVAEAEALGFKVFAAPSLEIIHGDASEFKRLKESLSPGIPIVFGSTTAADHCRQEFGDDLVEIFRPCEVIAIGPGTSARLESLGVRVDIVPEDYSSYGLVNEIKAKYAPCKVILVRSDSGTEIISDGLASSGYDIIDVATYRLEAAEVGDDMKSLLRAVKEELDWMAFTSPMSASTFFDRMKEMYGNNYLALMDSIKVAAIGRPTAEMLESLGRKPDLIPEKTTFHDLLLAILNSE